MELKLKAALVYISFTLCIEYRLCDELDRSNALKWTCICAAAPVGTNSYSPGSNCSTSCHCTPEVGVGGANEEGWTCLCSPEQVPQKTRTHDVTCFTSCNCTSGLSNTTTSPKKHISSKVIVVILLLCVVLTTIAFVSSAAWYFYRKDRCHTQSDIFSSDRHTSWNSATNLISHRSALSPEFQVSGLNPITGYIWNASSLFRKKKQTLLSCITQFSYIELEHATKKFSKDNLIGHGGSSNVYRGQLKDGRLVAVKKIKIVGGSDMDSEYLTEIELISRLNHCHVVPLLGYCIECQGKQFEKILVFEYMSNGNLRDCLDSPKEKEPLDWGTRVRIAFGVARGLEYLHEAAAPRILHRDIKSTNILLDDKYTAKITDLGMAKRLTTDDLISCTSSPARMLGTFGYFAPEYAIVGKASLKSDVFSFGVVILELITGHQPILKSTNKSDESLVLWAAPKLCSSKLVISELPDPLLKGSFPEEEMQIMAHLARECLHWDPEYRPSMSEVVQILSTISSDKAKRRNLSPNIFLSSSSRSIKSNPEVERHEDLQEVCIEKVELSCTNSVKPEGIHEDRCSMTLPVGRNPCDNHRDSDGTVLSAGYIDGLMLLMSNAKGSHAPDEEIVDLTEPRFESFVQENTSVMTEEFSI